MLICFRIERYNTVVDTGCQFWVLLGKVIGGDVGGGDSEL
jgi:hypothetical protein